MSGVNDKPVDRSWPLTDYVYILAPWNRVPRLPSRHFFGFKFSRKIRATSQAENMPLAKESHSGQKKKHLLLCFDDVGKNLAEKRSESSGITTFSPQPNPIAWLIKLVVVKIYEMLREAEDQYNYYHSQSLLVLTVLWTTHKSSRL